MNITIVVQNSVVDKMLAAGWRFTRSNAHQTSMVRQFADEKQAMSAGRALNKLGYLWAVCL